MAKKSGSLTATRSTGICKRANHTRTAADVERYRAEPYVLAGDVFAHPSHAGRAGWTWYTGSAGWMYRVGLEEILGLTLRKGALHVEPCIPRAWPGFEIDWRCGATTLHIRAVNPMRTGRGVATAALDGEDVDPRRIPIVDDHREHVVEIVLGARGFMASAS